MKEVIIKRYVKMFDLLDIEAKIELMAKLSNNINETFRRPKKNKNDLLESLSGSWEDVDDEIIDEIYKSRTISDKDIEFD